MKSAGQWDAYVSPDNGGADGGAGGRVVDDRGDGRPDADRYERVRERRVGVAEPLAGELDPVRTKRHRNEDRDRDGWTLAFRDHRERGVAGEHSTRPAERTVEADQPQPGQDETERDHHASRGSNRSCRSPLLRALLAQRRAGVQARTATSAQAEHTYAVRGNVPVNRRRVTDEIDEGGTDDGLRGAAA